MWPGNLLSGTWKLVYDITIMDTVKTLIDIEEEKTEEDSILKLQKNNVYNNLILTQYETVCLHIVEG